MMNNAFNLTLKAFFVLKSFKFLSCLFGHAEKPLDSKDSVNFETYAVTAWLSINDNADIA